LAAATRAPTHHLRGPQEYPQSANDPKIRFHETIKWLEQRFGDPKIILNLLVVSVTPWNQVGWWEGGMTEKDFENNHILFRDTKNRAHLARLFRDNLNMRPSFAIKLDQKKEGPA
jgi:hypothetical protein